MRGKEPLSRAVTPEDRRTLCVSSSLVSTLNMYQSHLQGTLWPRPQSSWEPACFGDGLAQIGSLTPWKEPGLGVGWIGLHSWLAPCSLVNLLSRRRAGPGSPGREHTRCPVNFCAGAVSPVQWVCRHVGGWWQGGVSRRVCEAPACRAWCRPSAARPFPPVQPPGCAGAQGWSRCSLPAWQMVAGPERPLAGSPSSAASLFLRGCQMAAAGAPARPCQVGQARPESPAWSRW